ncbi:hypothetical protein Q5P01_002980 [Channa striata]|uniref:Ig-like domain-containing protein n=1 Tax=Channa striata TaxID=64152 RepID=A0AA88T595_CHASR|nr:hypothetical protein Q5P01_002980 [Channa striata]
MFFSRKKKLCLCLFIFAGVVACAGQLNITAHPGENITLPCQASISTPVIAVEWTRPDLTPSQYVFLFRGQHIVQTFQHPSFVDRVDLLDRQMKDGNLSLSLRNVTSSDRGTYECRVKEKEERRIMRGVIKSDPINVVRLTVTDSDLTHDGINKDEGGFRGRLAAGLTSAVVLLLLLAVVSFVIYRKRTGTTEPNSYRPPAEQDDDKGM